MPLPPDTRTRPFASRVRPHGEGMRVVTTEKRPVLAARTVTVLAPDVALRLGRAAGRTVRRATQRWPATSVSGSPASLTTGVGGAASAEQAATAAIRSSAAANRVTTPA